MNNEQPLVSIIMPAYNAALFIGEAIASVLVQTYPHWELIIIDDGSTDDTLAQARQFRDPRIRLFEGAHSGYPSHVKNRGLRQAQGDFIAFLDADDLYEPDALESRVQYLLKHPDCVAVHGFERYINLQGQPIPGNWTHTFSIGTDGQLRLQPEYHHSLETFFHFNYYHLPALLFRKPLLDQVGLLDESLLISEDCDFYLRLYLHRLEQFHYIPQVIFAYRKYEQSITNNSARLKEVLNNIPVAIDAIHRRLGEKPVIAQSTLALDYYKYLLCKHLYTGDFNASRLILTRAFQNPHVPRLRLASATVYTLADRYLPWSLPLLSFVKNRVKAGLSFKNSDEALPRAAAQGS